MNNTMRMPRFGQYLLISSVFCSLWLSARAHAQAPADRSIAPTTDSEQVEARERYTRGMQLASEGKYQPALIEMQRAYSLNPSYRILYNLGQIYSHLDDKAAALTNYERFLAEGGSDIPLPKVTEVKQEIAKLRPHVARVELVVKGDGAEILLDDAIIGRGPMHKTILVNVGKHKFSVARPNGEPVTRVVPLAGEDKIVLELDQDGPAAATTPADPKTGSTNGRSSDTKSSMRPAEPAPDSTSSTKGVWLGWVATAALGIGTGIAGVVANHEANQLKDLRDTPHTTRQALDEAQSSTFRAALVTDVLLGATVVAGSISLYYTLSSSEPSSDKGQTAGDLTLQVGPSGLLLRSAF